MSFRALYNQNVVYFFWFSLFLFVGGILLDNLEFGHEFLYFNDLKRPFFNYFFEGFTLIGEAYTYFLVFLFLWLYKRRYAVLMPITGGLVSLVVWIAKKSFAQFRPAEYFDEQAWMKQIDLVPGLVLNTGDTTMPSGHTLSAFALLTLLAFIIEKNKAVWNTVLFAVALLVGISRVYLVQHFLKDIYTGAIFGVLLATFVYLAFEYKLNAPQKK
jgi:membrane-associated phospholipid phosphatase